jgi:hypothetical protein
MVDAILSLMPKIVAMKINYYLVGLEEKLNTCIHTLEKMFESTIILCLVDVGGIGKTTLIKEIYNHFVGHF